MWSMSMLFSEMSLCSLCPRKYRDRCALIASRSAVNSSEIESNLLRGPQNFVSLSVQFPGLATLHVPGAGSIFDCGILTSWKALVHHHQTFVSRKCFRRCSSFETGRMIVRVIVIEPVRTKLKRLAECFGRITVPATLLIFR